MIVRDQAIKQICSLLTVDFDEALGDKVALDFFAREGDWQTAYIAQRVQQIHAWEVNPNFEEKLKMNLPPTAAIQIGDSHELALTQGEENPNLFDMVIFDNPQGCYGVENEYCEHFDSLPLLPLLLKREGGVVIVNVKAKPFNYEDKLPWQRRRNIFYAREDTADIPLSFLGTFYENYYNSMGYKTLFSFMIERPQEDGLYSLV